MVALLPPERAVEFLIPYTPESLDLLLQGSIALAEIERNGFCVDTEYLQRTIYDTKKRVKQMEAELQQDEVSKIWKKKFGDKMNFQSSQQLGDVLFEEMGYEPSGMTEGDQYRTDEDALLDIDLPFVQNYLDCKKQKKLIATNLKGILREAVDGVMHCFFNLHNVISFRSCVAIGTLIEVVRDVSKYPKGIPIEKVKKGQHVYCYDDKRNLTLKRVLWAGKTGHRKVIRLHWIAKGKHGHLDLTPEHRIRLVSGEYVRADQLEGRDFRTKDQSKKSGKIRALALGRSGDRIWQTGKAKELLDHRFIYEQLIGNLPKEECVHHKDENHLNNNLSNLERMTNANHARLHAPKSLNIQAKRKGIIKRMENHKLFGDRWTSGKDNPNWKPITKFGLLRTVARQGGKLSKGKVFDFSKIVTAAEMFGVDLWKIKDRYHYLTGEYFSRGFLKRNLETGSKHDLVVKTKMNFYKVKRMLINRGFPVVERNNHRIVKIEKLEQSVDVYDIEVEDCHNFIANEICVHNSSDSINLQNQHSRDPELSPLIRRCFIAREGNQLVELDFKGAEVCTSVCVHKDPVMESYVLDKSKDMHRDLAMQLFMLPKEQVSKEIRFTAKNRFTFAEFYGDWFKSCTKGLWKAMERDELKLVDGTLLQTHLAKKGIKSMGKCEYKEDAKSGTLEKHVQSVEKDFWGNRFKVYQQWKDSWYAKYQKRGWFQTLTGFICQGYMQRNQVLNFPIQGPSFHCLLWTLIQLVRVELKKHNMKSIVVCQVHDSLVADCPPNELYDFLKICRRTIMVLLRERFPWLVVPLDFEVDVAPVGGSWTDKEHFDLEKL